MTEKVVGTSYVKQPDFSTLAGRRIPSHENRFGIDLIYTKAHLVAEPTNPYDATAIAVYVHDNNGDIHRIGYVPKNSELKPHLTGDDTMDMIVMDYHSHGMNTSYVLRGFE